MKIVTISLFILGFFVSCCGNISSNYDLFKNKKILILGGTGYLGRAITEEVLKYNPQSVTIFSRDEVKHFNCLTMFKNPLIKSVIGDIRDGDALRAATKNMDVVFHVAALKRMDALESNVQEAIKTDIMGSINVFNACVENNVPQVLFISTDKACSPINIYGACKFASEKIFTNYDKKHIKTKFVVTRFGNILQSTGSVIPIFVDKIKNGEDLTLTDERMTRFIVDKNEAVEIIFDALRYSIGGEIFSKRLAALKVIDLIDVIKEHFNVHNTVKVIGLRPGERMYEALLNREEMARAFEFNNLFIIQPSTHNFGHDDTLQELPVYMRLGSRVKPGQEMYYSSDQAVVSKKQLASLFEQLNILQSN